MFKCDTVSVLFFGLLIIANVLTITQGQTDSTYKLGEYYYLKCYNQTYGKLGVYEKLETDASEFATTFDSLLSSLPGETKNFCEHGKIKLERQLKVVVDDLKPCLYPDEKYLPDFIETSFKEIGHFLCRRHAHNLRSLFSQGEGRLCRNNLGDLADISNCFKKIFKPVNGHLTKKELCDDLGVAEKCFATILGAKCPNYTEYKDMNTIFFRNITQSCRDSGSIFQLNTILLLLPILLSYLFSKN